MSMPEIQTGAAGTYPGLRLIALEDRFLAAWIEPEGGEVRIAEFDERFALPAVTLGTAGGGVPGLAFGRAPGEAVRDVTLFWTGEDGVMMRRLPVPPTGSLIASDSSARC